MREQLHTVPTVRRKMAERLFGADKFGPAGPATVLVRLRTNKVDVQAPGPHRWRSSAISCAQVFGCGNAGRNLMRSFYEGLADEVCTNEVIGRRDARGMGQICSVLLTLLVAAAEP